VARRIHRLSSTANRTLARLGVHPNTPQHRALGATIALLARTAELPGPADFVTRFHPGFVFVRRVTGFNLWILYRFDSTFLDVVSARDAPPIPMGV
jgi:hypothetical protein